MPWQVQHMEQLCAEHDHMWAATLQSEKLIAAMRCNRVPCFQATLQDYHYVPSLGAVQGGTDACVPCRVKVMAELLRGIHQIKMCAWEQGFVAKVCSQYRIPRLLAR